MQSTTIGGPGKSIARDHELQQTLLLAGHLLFERSPFLLAGSNMGRRRNVVKGQSKGCHTADDPSKMLLHGNGSRALVAINQ